MGIMIMKMPFKTDQNYLGSICLQRKERDLERNRFDLNEVKAKGGEGLSRWPIQEIQEIRVQSLCSEAPVKQEMDAHSSILAWRITWTEEPGKLQSIGLQIVGHD